MLKQFERILDNQTTTDKLNNHIAIDLIAAETLTIGSLNFSSTLLTQLSIFCRTMLKMFLLLLTQFTSKTSGVTCPQLKMIELKKCYFS